MTETKIQIGGSCHLVRTVYGEGIEDVSLEYTEHSSDHWHSDCETSLTIDAEKAREIVAFLSAAFGA